MSIQKLMKWLALAGVGVLVSGCVAAPAAYSPGNVAYSDTNPGNFVADPAYAGGGYYEVVEVYEDPYYDVDPYAVSYGADPYYSAPYYGTFGTSLFLNSHGSRRHRHDDGHKFHSKHPDETKRGKRNRTERNRGVLHNRRNLTPEEIVARDQRQAACRAEGFGNCREKREANQRKIGTNTVQSKADVARGETQRERRAARQASCREAGFSNCRAKRRADQLAEQRTADSVDTRPARERRIRPASGRKRRLRDK